MSKVLAVIQVRLGSTRLPQKALMSIAGRPMVQHVVERVRCLPNAFVVLAVPYGDSDAFKALGLDVDDIVKSPSQREDDVLARFVAAVRAFPMYDPVIRVTADCPLWDPCIAKDVLRLFREERPDYASNVVDGYIDGTDVEVFTRMALAVADANATDEEREHVTLYMRRNLRCVSVPPSRSGPKLSVDTAEDLERVRAMVTA